LPPAGSSNGEDQIEKSPNYQSLDGISNDDELDLASVSSASQGGSNFNKMIQDFKKALGERKTPRNLILLNRAIIVIILLSLIISGLDYYY
jgi:hypothetical protein